MIETRLAGPSDHPALGGLFEEMQAHYSVPCPPLETILESLATMPAGTEILVAGADDIMGFAAFSSVYPGPSLGSGLFLKELYVSASCRGKGVGKCLMQGLARLALLRGHSRVDWTADRHNPRLLAFYDGLGGAPKPDKMFYRLDGAALAAAGAREDETI